MARIIEATEEHALVDDNFSRFGRIHWEPRSRGGIITKAAEEVAQRAGAKFIVAFTQSGDSAKRLARLRSSIPVLAFTPIDKVCSQLALTWGVHAFQTSSVEHTDEMVRQVDEELLRIGSVEEGDLVVIVAGSPPGIPGSTNALRIHRMGDAINEVAPAYRRS
jgi:pyruvate kinase